MPYLLSVNSQFLVVKAGLSYFSKMDWQIACFVPFVMADIVEG